LNQWISASFSPVFDPNFHRSSCVSGYTKQIQFSGMLEANVTISRTRGYCASDTRPARLFRGQLVAMRDVFANLAWRVSHFSPESGIRNTISNRRSPLEVKLPTIGLCNPLHKGGEILRENGDMKCLSGRKRVGQKITLGKSCAKSARDDFKILIGSLRMFKVIAHENLAVKAVCAISAKSSFFDGANSGNHVGFLSRRCTIANSGGTRRRIRVPAAKMETHFVPHWNRPF
jgi:hypothetical protein